MTRTLGFFVLLTSIVSGEDWPGFRGPRGDGTSRDTGFPTEWSPSKNILWRVPLGEPGNGSPIVVGDKLFYATADREGKERSLVCVAREDGRQLWKQSVSFDAIELTHKTNPYSPTTPLSDGQSVYIWHGSAGMHAYDMNGKLRWSRDSLGVFTHVWGLGASPMLVGDHIIQLCGPGERTFVVAIDRRDGSIAWQTPNEPGGSESSKGRYVGTWATPFLLQGMGQPHVICCFHSRVVGLDPANGRELWSIDGLSNERSDLCYAMPMVSGDRVVIMAGFGGPEFAFRLEQDGSSWKTERLWRNVKNDRNGFHPQRIGTGITQGDFLFMANADEAGSIECRDIRDGSRRWHESRTTDGPHWGSTVLAQGKLYIPGQKGITRVIDADTDRYRVLHENDLDEHCNATPAFSNGQIFIRTFDALWAIEEKP